MIERYNVPAWSHAPIASVVCCIQNDLLACFQMRVALIDVGQATLSVLLFASAAELVHALE
jgi:hypothetical protein